MQSERSDVDIAPGVLLVAAPTLLDANFRRTVVYLIDHRTEGTLGVILNRPSEVAVVDVLPNWGPHVSRPQAVFVGGPVEQRTALCLTALRTGESAAGLDGLVEVAGPVALVDLDTDPEPLVPKIRGFRVFAGYAGWDEGQLRDEIDRGDWFVVHALPDDVVEPPGRDLWAKVLRRQGLPLALFATHPADVSEN